jgi:uncharacterized protein
MWYPRSLLALPLALAATLGTASASAVRDQARMFSAEAVQKAEAVLDRVERESQVPVIVETIPSLNGEEIADVSLERAERESRRGVYILIAKKEHKLYDRVSPSLTRVFPASRQQAIREAFQSNFKKGDFDAGLLQAADTIASQVSAARSELRTRGQGAPFPAPGRGGMPPRRNGGGSGIGTLLGLGLLVVGVLFVFRLLGNLFGGGRAAMGQPGKFGGSYGPGYGYGGGGGGFMSSLFGGIGGAMAGNWLYDQFSGRHHGGGGYTDSSTYGGEYNSSPPTEDWSAGTGGGADWGGGDSGGGGDWGGGGGDWGGGGGDIGGGDW